MNWNIVLCIALCLVYAHTASVMKRDSSKEEAQKETECPGRQPCGWMVYNKITRHMEFFMNNTCKCSSSKSCEKSDEILSAGAFIYRCVSKDEDSPSKEIENTKITLDLRSQEKFTNPELLYSMADTNKKSRSVTAKRNAVIQKNENNLLFRALVRPLLTISQEQHTSNKVDDV